MSAALRANAPDLGQGAGKAGLPLHDGTSTGTATTTVTISAAQFSASDWAAGDVLLAHFVCTGNMTFTFPTGWTYRGSGSGQQHVSSSMSVTQATYVLTSTDISGGVSWVFSIGTAESFFIGTMVAVAGVDTTSNDGVDAAADSAASDATTSYTVPTVTPTAGTRFVVEGAGGRWNTANSGQTWSAPTGDTLAVTAASAGGTGVRQESSAISYLTSNNVTADGVTAYGGGTFNANPSTALAFAGGFALAFKVAAAAGSATVTPSAVAATTSLPAPTVQAASNATVAASAVSATGSVRAATVSTTSGVQFVQVAGSSVKNNNTNPAVTLGTVTDGDALLFALGSNKGTQTSWTDPAGLTLTADNSSGGSSTDSRTRTLTRLASGDSGAQYTWTSSPGANHAQICLEYAGVDATTPLAAAVSSGHDTTLLSGVTTLADKALVVVVLTLEGGGTVTSPPSTGALTFTLRDSLPTTSGTDDVTVYVYDAIQPTAGPTGNITWSGTPTNSTYQVFALRQAVAPFSTTVTPSVIAAPSAVPFGQINQGVQPSAVSASTSVPGVSIVASGSLTNVDVAQGWYTASTGGATSGTATVTLPTTPTQGNTLVIAANSDQPVTTPSGWTVADSLVNVSGLYLYTKTAGASEPATVSVTFSGVGAIAVAELVAASGSLDSATGQVTRTSGSAPVSVSLSGPTGSADEYVVAVMGSISAAQLQWDGWTDGFTEQADTSTALTTGNNVSVAVADYDLQGPATYAVSASTYDRSTGALAGSAAQALLVAFKAIAGSATVRAQTARFTGRALDAAVVVPVDATVTASPITTTTTVPTVAPTTPGSTVVPAQAVAAVGKVPAIASSTASSTVFVDTLSAPAAVVTPASVSGVGITAVTPSAVAAASSVPAPTVVTTSAVNALVPAQTIAASTSVPAVGLTTGTSATVTPNAYAALAAVLAPSGLANSVTVAAQTIAALTAVSSGNTSITVPTYTFTPPTVFDVPQIAVGVNSPMNRLAMHMNAGERGVSVWVLKDGTYTTQQPVYWEDVDHVFYGGHSYTVSAAEATTLEQYGFSVTEAVPQ